MSLMTRENVLKHLEEIGRTFKLNANPSSHSYENRSRASSYKPKLEACRLAYWNISKAGDIVEELKKLQKTVNSGIEANKINLLIIANTTGFPDKSAWAVVDGDLIFKR